MMSSEIDETWWETKRTGNKNCWIKKCDFSTGGWLIMSMPKSLLIQGDHLLSNYIFGGGQPRLINNGGLTNPDLTLVHMGLSGNMVPSYPMVYEISTCSLLNGHLRVVPYCQTNSCRLIVVSHPKHSSSRWCGDALNFTYIWVSWLFHGVPGLQIMISTNTNHIQ